MKTAREIFEQLAKAGRRITKPRKAIVVALLRSNQPLGIRELVSRVSADEASIYRSIGLLKQQGIIEEITSPEGTKRYAVRGEHHHHIMCSECGRVAHVPCREGRLSARHPDFVSVHAHDVTYYGRCRVCV